MNMADMVQSIYNTVVTTAPEKTYFWTSSPVNIKSIYPDIYNQLTSNDFIVGSTGAEASDNSPSCNVSGGYVTGSCPKTYDPSSGILTFSGFNVKNIDRETNYNRIWNSGTLFAVWLGTIGGSNE